MAEIKSISMEDGVIEVKLVIDNDEYGILKNHRKELFILPVGKGALEYELTTGKLGNSNRIMIPKKFLNASDVKSLDKKVFSNIFKKHDEYYLLIRLSQSDVGIPKFEDGE